MAISHHTSNSALAWSSPSSRWTTTHASLPVGCRHKTTSKKNFLSTLGALPSAGLRPSSGPRIFLPRGISTKANHRFENQTITTSHTMIGTTLGPMTREPVSQLVSVEGSDSRRDHAACGQISLTSVNMLSCPLVARCGTLGRSETGDLCE